MRQNVERRVEKTTVPYAKPLIPLFEAIVNSIDAIREAKRNDGRIEVRITRDAALVDGGPEPISRIQVIDNGIGFTDENVESFLEADSAKKASHGGQGSGRFSWLKVFARAEVTSVIKTPEGFGTRTFTFSPSQHLDEDSLKSTTPSSGPEQTIIDLREMKSPWREKAPLSAADIASDIISYCYLHLVQGDVAIILDDQGKKLEVTSIFPLNKETSSQSTPFEVGKHTFSTLSLRSSRSGENGHRLHFCAHGREIKTEYLTSHIPNLAGRIGGTDGFFYTVYVSGEYLDDNVSRDRSRFLFTANESEISDQASLEDEISLEAIRAGALKVIENELEDELVLARAQIESKLLQVIRENPRYRSLIHKVDKIASKLAITQSIGEYLEVLEKEFANQRKEIERKGKEIIASKQNMTPAQRTSAVRELVELASEAGTGALAEYVATRKVVLDFLDRIVKQKNDGSYELETTVHSLIFPMGHRDDEVDYSNHNLWLIDERLAYHEYLMSDIQLRSKRSRVKSDAAIRPDLAIFERVYAYADDADQGTNITVFEFKKPGRTAYGKDNPIDQVLDQVEAIREGKVVSDQGDLISNTTQKAPAFAYIVCDDTPQVQKLFTRADFKRTVDGEGWWFFHEQLNTMIEVVPYRKLVRLAKQRNKVLFDKLMIGD